MYISNVPISRPVHTGVQPDLDLNGIQWSNEFGLFYAFTDEIFSPIKAPTLFPTTGPIPGKRG
jgi:hypothetical protein